MKKSEELNGVQCTKFEPRNWRTPNEFIFVCVCQQCGKCATSMIDGGVALSKLYEIHE